MRDGQARGGMQLSGQRASRRASGAAQIPPYSPERVSVRYGTAGDAGTELASSTSGLGRTEQVSEPRRWACMLQALQYLVLLHRLPRLPCVPFPMPETSDPLHCLLRPSQAGAVHCGGIGTQVEAAVNHDAALIMRFRPTHGQGTVYLLQSPYSARHEVQATPQPSNHRRSPQLMDPRSKIQKPPLLSSTPDSFTDTLSVPAGGDHLIHDSLPCQQNLDQFSDRACSALLFSALFCSCPSSCTMLSSSRC
jgi:hypothetical protein